MIEVSIVNVNGQIIHIDEDVVESIIFSESNKIVFEVPFGDLKRGYDGKAFRGISTG